MGVSNDVNWTALQTMVTESVQPVLQADNWSRTPPPCGIPKSLHSRTVAVRDLWQ